MTPERSENECKNNKGGHQKHNKSPSAVHKCLSTADNILYELPDFYLIYKIPCGESGIVQA